MDVTEIEKLSSRSTRGTSEFASPNGQMWAQIFRDNSNLDKWIDAFVLELLEMRSSFRKKSKDEIAQNLSDISMLRTTIMEGATNEN